MPAHPTVRFGRVALFVLGASLLVAGCGTSREPRDTPTSVLTPTSADPTGTPASVLTPTSADPTGTPASVPSPTFTVTPKGGANADVVHVRAVETAGGTWTFHVTVQHPDTGWEDYADGWDVVTPDGAVVKPDPESPFTRLLLHPHVDEQPFTRSQGEIVLPGSVTLVRVRAHDLVDGYGGREVLVDLTVDEGPGYAIERRSPAE